MLKLLLDFKPYREVLKYAREHNLIEGTFGRFQAQTSKHKGIIREQEIARDGDWNKREILAHQDYIASIKDNQWAFKAIFQKAMIRLGKIVEFDYKCKDTNLGDINDVLKFLDRLYDKNILRVDANLPDYPFRLWTFIATNPGNEKIKVNKAVEDRIFSLLSLWYFGSRKTELDIANGYQFLSRRKLLNFFGAETNKAQWPGCTDAHRTLYKGFDVVTFYGREHEKMKKEQKEDMVRDRFSAILAAGLPELKDQRSFQQESEADDEIDS